MPKKEIEKHPYDFCQECLEKVEAEELAGSAKDFCRGRCESGKCLLYNGLDELVGQQVAMCVRTCCSCAEVNVTSGLVSNHIKNGHYCPKFNKSFDSEEKRMADCPNSVVIRMVKSLPETAE